MNRIIFDHHHIYVMTYSYWTFKKLFDRFQKRKQYLIHACQYANDVYTRAKMFTHQQRLDLQDRLRDFHS